MEGPSGCDVSLGVKERYRRESDRVPLSHLPAILH